MIFWSTLLAQKSQGASFEDLIQEAESLYDRMPDSSIYLSELALNMAIEQNDYHHRGRAQMRLALANMTKGNWIEANNHFKKAVFSFRNTDDSLAVANAFNHMGYSFQAMREYHKNLESQLYALRLREKYSDDPLVIAASQGAIGFIYQYIGELDKAMDYHLKAMELRKNSPVPHPVGIGFCLKNIGIIHNLKGEYDKAIEMLNEALDTFELYGNKQFVGVAHRHIGQVYMAKGKLENAETAFKNALKVAEDIGADGVKARVYSELGKLKSKEENTEKAIYWLSKAAEIAELSGDRKFLTESVYEPLAASYENQNNYEAAFGNLKKYSRLKDSLFNEESSEQIARLKTEFETENMEKENQGLRLREKQRLRERNFLLVGLGVAAILVFFIYRENRQRKKAFQELLEEKNRAERLLREKEALFRELEDAQIQLVQSEKMASLGQLTAGIAHEINNPINFVASNVQALRMDFEDMKPFFQKLSELNGQNNDQWLRDFKSLKSDMDLEFLQTEIDQLISGIERGARRTQNIITGLRTFSRSVGEKFAEADIHEGIEATLTILNSKFKHRIEIHKNYGDIPLINCQFEKLNQVFMNLISNAIDAIEGEGHIYITTKKEEDKLLISIRDSGDGMEATVQKKIFEPFYTTKEVGKGTGLGLAISYSIIKKHNGNIDVISEKGKGTEFIITLPINHKE